MDLRAQLEQHLGTAYSIGRELGGGGMSRVFVAEETRLGRTVVIKVLTPDLAQGINAERFEREIRLAASLQQANIVPVLIAGDVDGLPYFTMPFVEGESLRHHLSQGSIPVNDVVAILRDVTKALAYAHARGIVHRDIKPDNVLLSGGTAVVTDFGIAKAISASRTAAPGATLTQLGTSIGTPAYMAPEQVAGDPHLDHRVDLYSLGCMAHELLTGRQPFADRTPQRTLAAHLSESAPSVAAMRADCPAALVDLVARLMEKDPGRRPQSASEVLQILDSAVTTTSRQTLSFSAPGMFKKALLFYVAATVVVLLCTKAAIISIGLPSWVFPGAIVVMALGLPALLITAYVQRVARVAATATPTITAGGTMAPKMPSGTVATIAMKASPHITWRRTARGGVFALISFVVIIAGFMTMRALGIGPAGSLFAAGTLAESDRIVLADFVAARDDSALVPIVVEAVRAALSQSKSVHLLSQSDVADQMQMMGQNKDARLSDTLAAKLAQRAGAKAVLGGNIARAGSGYLINLQLRNATTGAILASFPGTADGIKDLLKTVDGLTRDLRSKIGESLKLVQHSIPLERATTTSLEALRAYSEGVTANDRDLDYPRAVRVLRDAVAKDSTFALAWRKLAVALGNAYASPAAMDSALERAARYADKLPDREKYLALGEYYRRHRTQGDRIKAFDAYHAAYAADSNSSVAANQLTYAFETRRQWDSMVRYSWRQLTLRPDGSSDGMVVYRLSQAGKTEEAGRFLDSIRRTVPPRSQDVALASARLLLYEERAQDDSFKTLGDSLVRFAPSAAKIQTYQFLAEQSWKHGQLKRATTEDSTQVAMAATSGSVIDMSGLYTAFADIVFRGRPADGVKQLDAFVAGGQFTSAAPIDRPYRQLADLYSRAGRPDKARELLKRFDAEAPAQAQASNEQIVTKASLGEIALAEKRYPEAITLFRQSELETNGEKTGCEWCTIYNLARAFDAAGQKDSTIAYYERWLAVPQIRRYEAEGTAAAHKRLGELYDERNDKAHALAHYTAFVDQWKGADPELQPVVTTIKKRIAELVGKEVK